MSDPILVAGLILVALTWLALRGMGGGHKPRGRPRRP